MAPDMMSMTNSIRRWVVFGLLLGLNLAIPIAQAAETVTYYYTNQQGTPLATADASGVVLSTSDYKPYGSQVLGSPAGGLGYTGHVDDPDSGLVYMQARYYDPVVGRFLSPDPTGKKTEFSEYAYVGDNPVNAVDPTGLFQCNDKASCESGTKLRNDFKKAQEHFKSDSPAYKSLAAGIKALGTENDGGAIVVTAVTKQGPTTPNAVGWGGAPKGKVPTLTINLAALAQMPDNGDKEASFAATGRHELQHVMDDMVKGDKPHDPTNEFWHEVRGVRAETPIWEGLGVNDPWQTWSSSGGLNMRAVYSEAEKSTNAYCPKGVCP
jgi:RHS repeat-associated protein